MPYQDRQLGEGSDPAGEKKPPVFQAQEQPNNARTVQIIIAIGLISAIVVAVFGTF